MFKNYKLIRWADGTYGVRKGWLFYKYSDTDAEYWWAVPGHIRRWCHMTEERARSLRSQFLAPKPRIDKGVVVK